MRPPDTSTVAALPNPSQYNGYVVLVTDALNPSTVSVGGGNQRVYAISNGSAWVQWSAPGGISAGAWNAITDLVSTLGTAATANLGSSAGQVPVIPVPMSQISGPVQSTINSITSQGGPATLAVNRAEVNLGDIPRRSGHFDITGLSGLTPGKVVRMQQMAGPYTGKGTLADEAEMDSVVCSAYALDAATIRAYWHASGFVRGNFKFSYRVGG